MPWKQLREIDMNSDAPPSFMPNNLSSDGNGRMSFAVGNCVKCTKHIFNCHGRCDFNLAYSYVLSRCFYLLPELRGKGDTPRNLTLLSNASCDVSSEKLDVTSMHWWSGLRGYNRPLLVITTESSLRTPATLQVWSTARGAGTRVFRCSIDELDRKHHPDFKREELESPQIQFARGIAQVSSGPCGPPLFCGGSNGSLYGVRLEPGREGRFKPICTIRDLSHAILVLAGDRRRSDYVAGADESGKLVVWKVEEEKNEDGENIQCYRHTIVYEYTVEEDVVCSLATRKSTVFAGHASGYLTVHNIERKRIMASIVTNTKSVTSIDVYQEKELVLICGEDCRVTLLGFSQSRGHRPVVHFSVALDAIVVGCALLTSPRGYPRIVALTWERCDLVQYDYEKSSNREYKKTFFRCKEELSPCPVSSAQTGLQWSPKPLPEESEPTECQKRQTPPSPNSFELSSSGANLDDLIHLL